MIYAQVRLRLVPEHFRGIREFRQSKFKSRSSQSVAGIIPGKPILQLDFRQARDKAESVIPITHKQMKNSPLHSTQTVPSDDVGIVAEAIRSYGANIVERSFQFGLTVVRACVHLDGRRDDVTKVLGRQLLRAATSVGSNVEEAQSAESRLDFVHKLRIAQKEARECRYWIRLMKESEVLNEDNGKALYRESDEILRVISKIIVNTRANMK